MVPMLCLNINALHFEKQIRLGKLLKYLQSALLKLLPLGALRQKLYAVEGRVGLEWLGGVIASLCSCQSAQCVAAIPFRLAAAADVTPPDDMARLLGVSADAL